MDEEFLFVAPHPALCTLKLASMGFNPDCNNKYFEKFHDGMWLTVAVYMREDGSEWGILPVFDGDDIKDFDDDRN